MNITAVIEERASREEGRLAVLHDHGAWSYSELHQRLCMAAAELQAAGVGPDTVVAQTFSDESQQLLALLASARLGATAFSVPANTPALRRARMLQDVGATVLATDLPGSAVPGLMTVSMRSASEQLVSSISAVPLVMDPQAPWVIASGSGSTGKPKYLPITHRQQWARMQAGPGWLPYGEQDVLLSLIGLDFYAAKLRYLEAFARGAAIQLSAQARIDPCAAAQAGRFTVLYGTVYHVEKILTSTSGAAAAQLNALRAVMVGGSAVSTNLRARIRDRLCPRLYVLYGANECSTSCCTRLDEVYAISGTVGHPHPGFELQIVDGSDRPLPPGEAGFVRIRSLTRIDGYLNDALATARAFRADWFYPGDLGRLTANGQLIHLGRADDMMIVNGINIYPAEIEQILFTHPAVADAAALPLRHRVHQDIPVAIVVLRSGSVIGEPELLRFARERLGRHALHRVFISADIPRNEQGKPVREEMRKRIDTHLKAERRAGRVKEMLLSQQARRLQVAFQLPGQRDFAMLDRWLLVMDDDLPPPASLVPDSQAEDVVSATFWLERCLRLARLLLQGIRVPVFAAPRILECFPGENGAGGWRATCELALIDDLPLKVYEKVLDHSFRLANWAMVHAPTRENREALYATIDKRVLSPCLRLWPSGKSTFQVLRIAYQRGIPFRALGSGIFQLGWGVHAQRIDRSTTRHDSAMGSRLSRNKALTARLLREAGLPAPVHEVVKSVEAALAVAQRVGWPVVVKPVDQERGEGVTVDVVAESLPAAFDLALRRSPTRQVIVERQVMGVCHRLFIARGRLLYGVKRLPMGVYGDGERTITELVTAECDAELLKPRWKRSEIKPLDAMARTTLAALGLGEQSIPDAGCFVPLRRIESTAWGGVDEEVTQVIHPENLRIALAATALFDLDIAGIDIISPDIAQPWHGNGAIINEVNFAPLLGGGEISRSYISSYLDRLLKGDGRIPVEVFVGGEAAWQSARQRWESLRKFGPGAYLSGANRTLQAAGEEMPMPLSGLYARTRALVLSPQVQVLVLVVQTDEFLRTGLPLDRVDHVFMVDRQLVASRDPAAEISAERYQALSRLLSEWQQHPQA